MARGRAGTGVGSRIRNEPAPPLQTETVLSRRAGITTTVTHGDDREVVVKRLSLGGVDASHAQRLEATLRLAALLQHPAVAAPTLVERDGDVLVVRRPFVAGETLADRLRRGPMRLAEALRVAVSVARALEACHAAGVRHLDLKPSNVFLPEDHHVDAVVVDLAIPGLGLPTDDVDEEPPLEATRYQAPEQVGLVPRAVDDATDLHAVGALLFEAVARRPTATGATVREVLRGALTRDVPSLRSLGVPGPRALDEVLQRLLRKDPGDRYQRASAVAGDLELLLQAIEAEEMEPDLVVGRTDVRATLTEPTLVGRRRELGTLMAALSRVKDGVGGLVLVEGDSGSGKSRLLAELAAGALDAGLVVYRGQGVNQAAQRPFQVLVGVVDGLLRAHREDPASGARVAASLGARGRAAASAFPELTALLGLEESPDAGPEDFGETRTLHALSTLVASLGTTKRPVVVLLDDVQWADGLSLAFIDHWSRTAGHHAPVLVVAAFRSEEVAADHPLRATTPDERVVARPLDDDEVAALVESMAGRVPETATAAVQRLAGGNPFMAMAVLHGLVEAGALVAVDDGWHVELAAMESLAASSDAAAVLVDRFQALPRPVLRYLQVGAVLGKVFDVVDAAELEGVPAADARAHLDLAAARRIVWLEPGRHRVAFVHDKLREALLTIIPARERARLHLAAARLLEHREDAEAFTIAYHYDAAGEPGLAFPHALAAAEKARAQYALEVAERNYRIARRGAPDDAATLLRIEEGHGDILMLRGLYEEAEEAFGSARTHAADDLARARLTAKLGELAFKRGDVEGASVAIEKALGDLGHPVPRSATGYVVKALREAAVQTAHSVAPRWFVGRRGDEGRDEALFASYLYSRLAHVYWFARGKYPCAWAHLREMNIAERFPLNHMTATAYAEHGPVMTMVPYFSRGLDYSARAVTIARHLRDPWREGQGLCYNAVTRYACADFEGTLEKSREAMRVLERSGDVWQSNVARWNIALAHYRRGELQEAAEVAARLHDDAMAVGDHQAAAISLGVWARAAEGRVPEDLVDAALDRHVEDVHARSEALVAKATVLLARGLAAEAARVLEGAQDVIEAKGLQQEYVAPVLPWWATALRHEAEALPLVAVRERQVLVRRGARTARRAVALARRYRNNLPHALRETAWAAAARRRRRVRPLLEESVAVAREQGARYEEVLTLEAWARIGAALGWPDAAARAEEARALRAALHPAESPDTHSLSLLDRFEGLLESGRAIASSLTIAGALHAAAAAARDLLRAESCVILRVEDAGGAARFEPVEGDGLVNRRLVATAVDEGRILVVGHDAHRGAGNVDALPGEASALAAPIAVRGSTAYCLYARHGEVRGLFGDAETRLASYVATLTGAAIENAEGFRSLTEAHDALRTLDVLKTQFINTAAHELRTPLVPLRAQLHLLKVKHGGDERRFVIIERNLTRLTTLVEDLLEASRLQAGRLSIEPVPHDLHALLQEAIETFQAAAEQRGLAIRHERHGTGATMLDPDRIGQVLYNLLSNAIKFSEPGSTIDIESRIEEGEAVVRVRDHGLGIDGRSLGRLFQPFSQVHDTARVTEPGSGLGLYVSRGIIELHGGRIWAESDGPAKGSTFAFTVPRGLGRAGDPAASPAPPRDP